MSWLNNTPFRGGFTRQRTPNFESTVAADPDACYASFKEHWQQAFKIIQRSQQSPSHDDVLGVVNHLEQMVTLLLYELKNRNTASVMLTPASSVVTCTPCLEYLLLENLLDKVYEWGLRTGKYRDAVRLEQIKLYEVIVNISNHELLVHEPFLRPLLKLLLSCQGEVFPEDVEKWLVTLLYQLCVSLMQKVELLDLFFVSTPASNTKFIIFSLLIPFVHSEGAIGLQARDALLLCMSLSKKNINIAEHSNVCPMLATGLSGLYSVLPRQLKIETEDWHRLTPDDVKEINDLALFMNSLEFCNGVAQVAHPIIKRQLLDFLYHGFLVPVLRPALLQATEAEQVAAIAYLDLIMRSVTEPGLLPVMVRFLLEESFNDVFLLEVLVYRIDSTFRLSLVTLALFETLIELNCEDIMLELIFKHLRPCSHVMLSQRHLVIDTDTYSLNTDKLFSLVPTCCRLNVSSTTAANVRNYARSMSNGSNDSSNTAMSLPTNWNHYGTQVNESLLGNYHAYLCDARQKIAVCRKACQTWSSTYDCLNNKMNMKMDPFAGENFLDGTTNDDLYESGDRTAMNSLQSLGDSSGYESLKYKIEDNGSSKMQWKQSNITPVENTPLSEFDKPLNSDICSSVGLFLDIILEKLSNMLANNIYVNLHLTGLISRLAIYPQTLLQSYLLNHQLVLQPNVQSIFQVVGSLKQKIDEYMNRNSDPDYLLAQARHWLFDRETRILNARRKGLDSPITQPSNNEVVKIETPTVNKISLANSISSMFRRTSIGSNLIRSSNKSISSSSSHNQPESILLVQNESTVQNNSSHLDNVALCTILLDEWLKELAAISQEQTIAQISELISKNFLH